MFLQNLHLILCFIIIAAMNFTTNSDHKLDLYYEIFEIFSKGKKAFGTKDLGEVMQSYGMKPSELELQVCFYPVWSVQT